MTTQKLAPPQIPACGFIRLKQVLEIIPVSKSSWWDGIKKGLYPPGIRIGKRVTVWSRLDIQALIDRISTGNQPLKNNGDLVSDAVSPCTDDHV